MTDKPEKGPPGERPAKRPTGN